MPLYGRVYGRGTYAKREYRDWLRGRTRPMLRRHRLAPVRTMAGTGLAAPPPRATQLPSTSGPVAVPAPAPAVPTLF